MTRDPTNPARWATHQVNVAHWRREQVIRQLTAQGITADRIANAAGLTVDQVNNILRRAPQPKPEP